MSIMVTNLDTGTLIASDTTLTIGTIGDQAPDTIGTQYWYSIAPVTNTVNGTAEEAGEGLIGTVVDGTRHSGTSNILKWTPNASSNWGYRIYKGTADASGTYMNLFGTVGAGTGTWTDPVLYSVGTGGTTLYNLAYTVAVNLPSPATYNAFYEKRKISHRTINLNMQTYRRGNIFNSNMTFDHLNDTERDDFEIVYNWDADIRLFPYKEERKDVFFNVIWNNNWDFQLTTPTITTGGWNANINFVGIENIADVSDTV